MMLTTLLSPPLAVLCFDVVAMWRGGVGDGAGVGCDVAASVVVCGDDVERCGVGPCPGSGVGTP